MKVELGNPAPKNGDGTPADLGGAPAVTYITVPDEYSFDENVDVHDLQRHLYRTMNTAITNRPKDEALMAVVHSSGVFSFHSGANAPTWVHCSDNPAFEKKLAEFFDCPAGRPANVEDTHFTRHGPPGVSLPITPELNMLLTNNGRDCLDRAFLGGSVGITGTATATGTTSLTNTGAAWTVNAYTGMVVVAGGVYAVILSNTATVLTVDRWYNVLTPSGAAGTTPSGTTVYAIMPGGAFALFMGLSNTNITPTLTDTTMTGEITTGGGGLIRKGATWAHTAGTTTTTLTGVFTVNGSDVIPVTCYAININTSLLTGSAVTMVYETSMSTSATLSAIGDQLTVTETVTSA